ncbi:MAG: low specificity L-threonine aldolase [Deltaproteobacteria bacterium]|nr:low specificity L-threonine aldolase [Deltaproteobacteria bacterium]
MKSFGSDNHAGAHADVIAALLQANTGHTPAYGQDPWTEQAQATLRRCFGDCDPYFVFNGTAANVLSLGALLARHESVLCSELSHLNVDECGAPERVLGCKLVPIAHHDGKLVVEDIEKQLVRGGDQHFAQPRVLSIAQPTELGTVYSLAELRELTAFAHARGLLVHMDGARLPNAVVSLDCTLQEIVQGIDVLSLGGTKNGLVFGEAVILLRKDAHEQLKYLRKQAMQLASKSRFIGAQFHALFSGDLWRKNAAHAVAMAKRLEQQVKDVVTVTRPVQANAVFAILPHPAMQRVREQFFFYVWDEHTNEVRWMTSFDTSEQDVDAFAAAIRAATGSV